MRYRCKEIGSYARAQELLRQGHTYLDSNGDGEACGAEDIGRTRAEWLHEHQ
jgi:hypothetical protein